MFAPGLRPPAYVDTLTVRVSGQDLVLEWSEVTHDVYGKPADVVSYEILRGTPPGFTNGDLAVIDNCVAPCATWTDTLAADESTAYIYRVRAIDGASVAGGLGSNRPGGIRSLSVSLSITPGNVVLSWAPVTSAEGGGPTDLTGYRVYASDTPFSVHDIVGLPMTPIATLAGTSLEIAPAGGDERYYSVLAEDVRGQTSPY